MTSNERIARACAYVLQAVALLDRVEAHATMTPDTQGEWVSLRRNLESAAADLKAATATPEP